MQRLLPVALLAVLCAPLASAQDAKPDAAPLRVLFVGHDPSDRKIPFADMAEPRTYQLYRERTSAFESLLRYHFEDVRVVYGKDYEVSMSDDVDVTIFDTLPNPLHDPERDRGAPRQNSYLPETFSRPALTISMNSARIGEPIGLKHDWL